MPRHLPSPRRHTRRRVALLLFFAALCCLCLAFGSCNHSGKSAQQPVTTDFECDVQLTYRDMNVSGHLTRYSAGTLSMDFEQPDTLKGLTMIWDGETISVKMHGLSFGVDPSTVPESALGKGILDVLDNALRSDGAGQVSGGQMKTAGESVNGEFELISDPETGELLSMKVPSLGITATFSNFAANSAS